MELLRIARSLFWSLDSSWKDEDEEEDGDGDGLVGGEWLFLEELLSFLDWWLLFFEDWWLFEGRWFNGERYVGGKAFEPLFGSPPGPASNSLTLSNENGDDGSEK